MSQNQRIIITGASGFIGKALLNDLKESYRIFGLARRTQAQSGAPVHPNITWHQCDICDKECIERTFRAIDFRKGEDIIIHLAAYFDFTGDENPEYQRVNVDGMRNLLEHCKILRPASLIFASSLAISEFPKTGKALNESSPPDGKHIYSKSKKAGEEMLKEYEKWFPSCIIRFAAVYSDWCEYPPLFSFLETCLSNSWNSRIVPGAGKFAIPYLYIRDASSFIRTVIKNIKNINPGEVLIASDERIVSQIDIFKSATSYSSGRDIKPVFIPRELCRFGIMARSILGYFSNIRPFERCWMCDYIDRQMRVEFSRTTERLGWKSKERFSLLKRMPFILENRRNKPDEWLSHNQMAMDKLRLHNNLKICRILYTNEDEINRTFIKIVEDIWGGSEFPDFIKFGTDDLKFQKKLLIQQLINSVKSSDRSIFIDYCGDTASYMRQEGFKCEDVCRVLEVFEKVCRDTLKREIKDPAMISEIRNYITLTVELALERVLDIYEADSGASL